ncbi:MAG: signal peptide peptidase [Firmicutes bacterium]|nr:signal peptide peptidase [Bacillota bacterium]
MYDIAESSKFKGVILRINSPGGSAAASQEIYEAVEYIRSKGKTVFASMADVAASGGYMIAAACDKIIASSSTFTGSIGVIMQIPYYKELAEKVGVSFNTIKSGELKDMGNPMRSMTDAERKLLQSMANMVHEEFISLVAKGRNMDIDKVRKLADGRIFTGRQAYENGLVDQLGNYFTAIEEMKKALGINEIKIVKMNGKKSRGINISLNTEDLLSGCITRMKWFDNI